MHFKVYSMKRINHNHGTASRTIAGATFGATAGATIGAASFFGGFVVVVVVMLTQSTSSIAQH
jgi:hypothetical protein